MPHFLVRLSSLLAASAVFLTACSATESARDDDTLLVVTTFTVIADMAREVAGERATVESITKVGVEVHGYEPTAQDVIRTSGADLVLHHGMGLEAWFADFLHRIDAPSVTITDGIVPMPIAGTDAPNPHAWMSPQLGIQYVNAIRDALIAVDPDGAAVYTANAADYVERIAAVGEDFAEQLQTIPERSRVLVTCEGAFSYLAAEAGMSEVYLWPVNVDSQATARSVADAIQVVRDSQVPAVFCESTVSADSMMQVVREAPTSFGGVLFVDSLTDASGAAPSYLAMLEHNARTIATALAGEQ